MGPAEFTTKLLGFHPGIWPVGNRWLGTAGTSLAAYLASRYAAAPALSFLYPQHFGEQEDERRAFAKRLGLLAGVGTGALGAYLSMPSKWNPMARNVRSARWSDAPLPLPLPPPNFASESGVPGSSHRATRPSRIKRSQFSPLDFANIPVAQTISSIQADPVLGPFQKAILSDVVQEAAQGKLEGLVSTRQLLRAAIDTGLGAAAGHALGNVFGLPTRTKRRLRTAGMLGGLLLSTGVVKP